MVRLEQAAPRVCFQWGDGSVSAEVFAQALGATWLKLTGVRQAVAMNIARHSIGPLDLFRAAVPGASCLVLAGLALASPSACPGHAQDQLC